MVAAPACRPWHSRLVIDPELAAILGALAFGVLLTLPGLHRAARRAENFCESCGRRILLGQRTCDCD